MFSFASLHSQELEIYATDSIAIGSISEFTQGTIGHGIGFSYTIPPVPFLGASVRIEHSHNLLSSNSLASWNNFSFMAGLQIVLTPSDFIILKPELDAGCNISLLRPKTLSTTTYTDLLLQLSFNIAFYSKKLETKNLAFVLRPFYRLLPEADNIGQYAGINAGIKLDF